MAKNLKEYGEELKKMTQDTSTPKPRGKIEYPSAPPPKPTTSTIDNHIKEITKRKMNNGR